MIFAFSHDDRTEPFLTDVVLHVIVWKENEKREVNKKKKWKWETDLFGVYLGVLRQKQPVLLLTEFLQLFRYIKL